VRFVRRSVFTVGYYVDACCRKFGFFTWNAKPFDGWTNKRFPPHEFTIPTCMITNFHTPKSTLLMMVSAFCGHDLMKRAYEEAIKEEYKFYSYGDAMLII
jgi:S-adenosylmethionine:tRNA-ribosyltransferase-isomerase (queuine synthetase)